MPSVSLFGAAPRVTNIVLREQFTGDGSDTTFQLTNSPGNCTFNKGAWAAGNTQTAYPAHVTGTDKKPTYDSIVILVRNRVSVSSINSSGLVTLDYAPRSGVDFYIWYWYALQPIDEINAYREDFVASMEAEAASHAGEIVVDPSAFDGILSGTDTTLQVALNTIDDHLHDGQTLQMDGINSDGGAFAFTTTGPIALVQPLTITDATVDSTSAIYTGLNIALINTAGSNNVIGQATEVQANGGSANVIMPLYVESKITSGTVGYAYNYFYQNLNGGTVTNDVYGLLFSIDQEASNTIGGNAISLYVAADLDGTVTGTSYMLYLNEATGVDYGIYQNGTAANVLGGDLIVPTMSQIGGATNHSAFAADGTLSLAGTARTTKFAWISASGISAPGESGATLATNTNGYVIYSFVDNLERYVRANMKIPDDMDVSADSYICVGWSSPAQSLNCDWEVDYLITAANGVTDQAGTNDANNYTTSSSTADGLNVSQIVTISGGTIQANDACIHIILQRDGNDTSDTLGDVAELHGMAIQYTSNKLGT